MKNIDSVATLKEWLVSQDIDISRWGVGPTKTVENLWDEIVNGETYLQDNPPLRIIQVVQVIIRDGNRILLEAEQELDNQQRRSRNFPPSEKMKPGETYTGTATRCLQEELGAAPHDITIVQSTHRQRKIVRDSPSYPGLDTQYIFHAVEAKVKGLPNTDFWTANAAHAFGDPVKWQHWVWQVGDEGPC